MNTASEAIVEAAFRLFASQGYSETSVDDIVGAAGVSRSSFFRQFGSKEKVIFPNHDAILAAVEDRLSASTEQTAIVAVSDAVRLVLFHYIAEGERARSRYRLTSTVPELHDQELVSGARYQRLFRRYISAWGDHSEESQRRAELMSAAVIAAHNRVLRRWLRNECLDPHAEIEEAMGQVHELFRSAAVPRAIVVVRTGESLDWVADQIKQL